MDSELTYMKKALIVLLILAIAGGAFAQLADGLRITAQARAGFIPWEMVILDDLTADDGTKTSQDNLFRSGLGNYNGNGRVGRQRIIFSGNSEKVGFTLQVQQEKIGRASCRERV